jgi:hypothetical protein
METTITGLFPDAEAARRARLELVRHGFADGSVALLTRQTTNLHALLGEETADAARGAMVGLAVGGVGMAIGASMMALPALALFETHWLVVALIGGVCGAIAGGAIGFLIGSATGHQMQEEYESGIARGGEVLAVNTDRAHATQALALLRRCGGTALSTSVHQKHHANRVA